MDNMSRSIVNRNTKLHLYNEGWQILEKVIEAKENFGAEYKHRKGFYGCGVGKYGIQYVINCYVSNLNCEFVQEIKARGSIFQGTPVRFFETGEIKAYA